MALIERAAKVRMNWQLPRRRQAGMAARGDRRGRAGGGGVARAVRGGRPLPLGGALLGRAARRARRLRRVPRSQKRNARGGEGERAAKRLAKKGGKQDKWTAQIALDSTPHKARWQAGDENAAGTCGSERRRRARGAAERARAVFDGAAACRRSRVGNQSRDRSPSLWPAHHHSALDRTSKARKQTRRGALFSSVAICASQSALAVHTALSSQDARRPLPRRHHLPARPALRPRRRRVGAAVGASVGAAAGGGPPLAGSARRRRR